MKTLPEQDGSFQTHIEGLYRQMDNDALQKSRVKAWQHFLTLGLPSRHVEAYRYIPLRNLYSQLYRLASPTETSKQQISSFIYPECRQSVLVFVNGHYMPELSDISALPKRVVVSSLSVAMQLYSTLLNNQWAKFTKEEGDPFAALNGALHKDGIFLYLPPKTIVETPLQLLHIVDTGDSPMLLVPRLQLFAGAQSQMTLVSSTTSLSGKHYWINQFTEIALDEGAHVHYTQIASEESSIEKSSEVWHFDAVRAHLKRNSNFKTVCMTKELSGTTRYDYRVALSGENAETSLNGVWNLSGKNESHTNVLIDHQAPHCRSMQLYKGVLDDFAKSSFEGKILVRQAAQKTEAFQLNNNLLLSDRAHADSKPNLEIFADDVKATHGATVGQLDNEQLFYMKTRGFSLAQAQKMLVHSFCQEVLDQIVIPSLKKGKN